MSLAIRTRPGSRGAHSGRKRHPSRRSDGHLHRELGDPAQERAQRPADHDLVERQAQAPEHDRPEDRHDVEEGRREGGDAETLLRVEHPHRDGGEGDERQERHHHPGQEDGQLGLPGLVVEAGRQGGDERPGEDDRQHDEGPQQDGQQGQDAVGEGESGLAAALLLRPGVDGDEGGGERPLREEVPQQVGDAEADPERVGVIAGARGGRRRPLRERARAPSRRASWPRRAPPPGRSGRPPPPP